MGGARNKVINFQLLVKKIGGQQLKIVFIQFIKQFH